MNHLCSVSPSSAVSIGLIEGSGGSGTNPFLDQALDSINTVGFTAVAAWRLRALPGQSERPERGNVVLAARELHVRVAHGASQPMPRRAW
jgi:hypothetical protein